MSSNIASIAFTRVILIERVLKRDTSNPWLAQSKTGAYIEL
ncbi:MAG: hypothetical protein ACO2O2_11745 [Acidilobaceae archaeon]